MSIKQPSQTTGYDQEELYFERLNRDLIKKIKNEHEVELHDQQRPLAQVIVLRPRAEKKEPPKKQAA